MQTVLITGCSSGFGLETARYFLDCDWAVVATMRRPRKDVLPPSDRLRVLALDVTDPASIERAVAEAGPIDVLVNNAGIGWLNALEGTPMASARELFETNTLGLIAMTQAVLPQMRERRAGVIVNVSSREDPNFTEGYDSRAAYTQSKTGNVLFAVELDRRWAADGIRGYAAHRGVVGTKLNSSPGNEALKRMGLIDEAGQPIIRPVVGKKTPSQGASTIVFAATSPLLADIGGVYLKDNDISPLDDGPRQLTAESIPAEVASHSIDQKQRSDSGP